MSTYAEMQRIERRRAMRLIAGVVIATIAAVSLFGFALSREPAKLPKTAYERVASVDVGADAPAEAPQPSLGQGLEAEGSPDASLRRRLVRLQWDDEGEVRRLLEAYRAVGVDAEPGWVGRFCDSLERAFQEDDRIEVKRAVVAVYACIPDGLLLADPFGPRLGHPDAAIRRLAVGGVARHGRDRRWHEIVPLADDPDPEVRAAVATALEGLRGDDVQKVLLKLLVDPDDGVVAAASPSLGKALGRELPQAFVESFRSKRQVVRLAATEALGTARGPAAPTILAGMVRDESWQVRRAAIRGLSRLRSSGATAAIRALEDVALDGAMVRTDRFEALQALAAMPDLGRPAELVRVAQSDPDPVLRLVAARTCLAHRDTSVVPALVALLDVKMSEHCDEEDEEFVEATAATTLKEALALAENLEPTDLPAAASREAARLDPEAMTYSPVRIYQFW